MRSIQRRMTLVPHTLLLTAAVLGLACAAKGSSTGGSGGSGTGGSASGSGGSNSGSGGASSGSGGSSNTGGSSSGSGGSSSGSGGSSSGERRGEQQGRVHRERRLEQRQRRLEQRHGDLHHHHHPEHGGRHRRDRHLVGQHLDRQRGDQLRPRPEQLRVPGARRSDAVQLPDAAARDEAEHQVLRPGRGQEGQHDVQQRRPERDDRLPAQRVAGLHGDRQQRLRALRGRRVHRRTASAWRARPASPARQGRRPASSSTRTARWSGRST